MCENFTSLPYPPLCCEAYGQERLFNTTLRLTLLAFHQGGSDSKPEHSDAGFVVEEVAYLRALCFCHAY